MSFSAFGINDRLVRALDDLPMAGLTPLQQRAIPVVLAGDDLLAGVQAGSGKTATLVLPVLDRLLSCGSVSGRRAVRALVLTPTPESALQVAEHAALIGKYAQIQSTALFGGEKKEPQTDSLTRGVDVVVATPEGLLDHFGEGVIDLSTVEIFVVDETDRMLDMGLLPDLRRIVDLLPEERQSLLFSDSSSREMKELASWILHEPVTLRPSPGIRPEVNSPQQGVLVDRRKKRGLLRAMIEQNGWERILIYCRTKHAANRLTSELHRDGITAQAIHGNRSQHARLRALAGFLEGKLQVLVATDIAAQGLDLGQLPLVVSYELPFNAEDYFRRLDRVEEAGAAGMALALVDPEEMELLEKIEKLMGRSLPLNEVEGFQVEVATGETERRPSQARTTVPPRENRQRDRRGPRRESPQPRSDAQAAGHQGQRSQRHPQENQGRRKKGGGQRGGHHDAGEDRWNRREKSGTARVADDDRWNRVEMTTAPIDDGLGNRKSPLVEYSLEDEDRWNRWEPEEEISEEEDDRWNRVDGPMPSKAPLVAHNNAAPGRTRGGRSSRQPRDQRGKQGQQHGPRREGGAPRSRRGGGSGRPRS